MAGAAANYSITQDKFNIGSQSRYSAFPQPTACISLVVGLVKAGHGETHEPIPNMSL